MWTHERVTPGPRLVLIAAAVLVVAVSPVVTGNTQGAAGPTVHVIVKLRPTVAAEAAAAADDLGRPIRVATAPEPVRLFLARHGLSALSPVHPGRLAAAARSGRTDSDLSRDTRLRFAARSLRHRGAFRPPDLSRTFRLEAPASPGPELDALIARLSADPDVEYAEEDKAAGVSLVPNDPYFSSTGTWGQAYADLYGLKKIGADAAWDTVTGENVTVAVIDTGVDYTHVDLANNVWTNAGEIPGNGVDDDGNGYVDDVRGWDFVGASYGSPAPDADPADGHGHGTHVAGTVAAEGDNGVGVIGVAWRAHVMAVKGLDDGGSGLHSQLAASIAYAADNGADVINASWGGSGTTQTLADAVQYAYSLGVVFVAAAGNSAVDARGFYPASYPSVITVAASDASDQLASFSNFGPRIDVAAPGVDVLSLRAQGTSRGTPVGDAYARMSGTSMASPHVAGLAALILGRYPAYSTEQVRQAIRASASDPGPPGFDMQFGYGRIDAAHAVTLSSVLEARILDPSADGTPVTGLVTIAGTVQGAGFASYELAYGSGATPSSWTVLETSTTPVSNAPLGTFDAGSVPDGAYTVRLTALDAGGQPYVDRRQVVVDYVHITGPTPPYAPSAASTHKPGAPVVIEGDAGGASFERFRVEWAPGINPASGWSATGVTLAGEGLVPVTQGPVATWDTTGIAAAGFYTVRLIVDDTGFSSEARTLVYLEPSLLSAHWPRRLHMGAWPDVSPHPAQDDAGQDVITVGTRREGLGKRVWRFSADGATLVTLDDATYNDNPFQVASADLDGQVGTEVLAPLTNVMHAIRPDGTTYSFAPPPGHNLARAVPVLAELDAVPGPEALAVATYFPAGTGRLQAWHADGTPLGGAFPVALADRNQSLSNSGVQRIVVGDLRGDGEREIVVAAGPTTNTFSLRLFGPDGTEQPFTSPAFDGQLKRLAVADLDGDGAQEVLALAYGTNMVLHVLGADGTPRPGWPVTLRLSDPGLAVADHDRDGRQEVIVTCAYWLYVLRYDGQNYSPAWPRSSAFYLGPPVAGDLDGDGKPEIVVAALQNASISGPLFPLDAAESSRPATPAALPAGFDPPVGVLAGSDIFYYDYRLFVVRSDAATARSWQLAGIDGQELVGLPVPLLADVDGDGGTDIVLSASTVAPDQFLVEDSLLTVLATGAPYKAGTVDWPLIRHDEANTCALPRDRTAPTVSLTAPASGATITDVTTVAAAAGDDVYVAGVQFRVDGVALGAEDSTAPFAVSWNPHSSGNGLHTLTAVARDTGGNLTTSAPVAVTVDLDLTAPAAAITFPPAGFVASGPLTVTADASDDRGVSHVELAVDGSFVATDTAPPYVFDWDPRTLPDGAHSLVATAYDAAGNAGPSAPVTGTVAVAPTVSLTAPAAGATLSGTSTLTAQATDNSGVVLVEFYAGSTLVGADTAAPWSVTWNALGAADGPYTLTARASDAAGNVGTSTGVPVTVSHPPAVSITSPAPGTVLSALATVTADASDAGGIARVELLVDGVVKTVGTSPPYAFDFDPAAYSDGSHGLVARAVDAAGNVGTSATVSVTVAVPPVAVLTAPPPDAVLSGTAAVSANALDNGVVTRVEFYVDGVLAATDATPPWSVSLNTWTYADGAHTLSAKAYDAAGYAGASAGVTVTTRNGLATYDATLRIPKCAGVPTACDSGALLNGRGTKGPEPNQPNTVNASCADGTGGTYHVDESHDRIRVTTVDGSTLAVGRTVRIEATVWAYAGAPTSDKLDLYYAANANAPAWTLITTLTPAAAGAQTLSATYTLPYGAFQAVRAGFRYGGSAAPCTTGSFDDHDDIAFAVDVPPDNGPPTATITSPESGSSFASLPVTVSADAADDSMVARVELYANGSLVGVDSSAPYTFSWNAGDGAYSLVAKAYDPPGNVGTSAPVSVTVNVPPTTSITSPAAGATVSGTVTVTAQAADNTGVSRVELYVDDVIRGTDTSSPYSFVWDTTTVTPGSHALKTIAYDLGGTAGAGAPVTVQVTAAAPGIAAYDPVLRVPRCATAGTSCDSGTLLVGRAALGPEPNTPNTVAASCADGTAGSYHVDESNDRIRISTVDGTPLAAGKNVRIDVTVWAYAGAPTSDKLDLYYAANANAPVWTFITTLTPTAGGTQSFSAAYFLPSGSVQAVRARFRYGGTAAPCGSGSYTDHDDLVFAVQ
jgi:subtilisin family serine protease